MKILIQSSIVEYKTQISKYSLKCMRVLSWTKMKCSVLLHVMSILEGLIEIEF